MHILRYLLLPLLMLAGMAQAQFPGMGGAPASVMTAKGNASTTAYKAGESFYIALDASVAQPWHAYFRNPATFGEAMTAELKAPEGFTVEGPYFSAPEFHKSDIGVAYTHQNPTVVWKVTPQANAPQNATFTASCTAQCCSDEGCNPPETKTVTVDLAAGAPAARPDWKGQEKKVETLGESPLKYTLAQDGNTVTISGLPADAKEAYFFSDDNCISPTAEQKLENGVLTLQRNDNSDPMAPVKDEAQVGKPLEKLSGLLVADGKLHTINGTFAGAAAAAPAAEAAAPAGTSGIPDGLFTTLISLFLGGLILNLMPCVFPVIGLKVMSFVELGGGDRRKVFLHSFAFVLGILVSFWVLAVLLAVLLSDSERSWAVWMQNPWIVYCIMLLLLVLGLSMFGLFEIGVGATGAGQKLQNKGGLTGSFFQGLFVTVVATPCSAPFLSTSLPAAMAMPAGWMILALTFMGLGLAFPYLVLGCFPSLVRFLPRPGAWMESLKQGLSFLLFAAAAWFLDVYLVFWPETENTTWVLINLVVICAAFWVYGRWCPMYCSKQSRITGFIIALVLLAVGVRYSAPLYAESEDKANAPAAAQTEFTDIHHNWYAWTPELMQKALDAGHPVYVDYTAKWCATCQSNKKMAYTDAVYKQFADRGVVLMRADKTKPRADIDAELKRLNRGSVPVNVMYVKDKEPAITQPLLTESYMAGFINDSLQGVTTTPAASPPAAAPAAQKAEEPAAPVDTTEYEGGPDDDDEDDDDDEV